MGDYGAWKAEQADAWQTKAIANGREAVELRDRCHQLLDIVDDLVEANTTEDGDDILTPQEREVMKAAREHDARPPMEWTDNQVWTRYIAGRWHWWDEGTNQWLKT